jgi:hypothetical protein
MEKRMASHWRAFRMTGAIVGAVNIGLLIYFASRPTRTLPDGFPTTISPQWIQSATTGLNFPGFVVVKSALVSGVEYPPSRVRILFLAAIGQTISTAFWAALIAAAVRVVNPPRPESRCHS